MRITHVQFTHFRNSWEWNIRIHTPILYHTFRLCLCCIPGDSTIVTQYYARWYIFKRPSISCGTGTYLILYRVDSKCKQIKLLLIYWLLYIWEYNICQSQSYHISPSVRNIANWCSTLKVTVIQPDFHFSFSCKLRSHVSCISIVIFKK